MSRIGAVLFVVMVSVAPEGAWAQQSSTAPPPLSYPRLVTSIDGYWQGGTFNTGSATTAHASGARAYDVMLGVRFNEHLLIGLRGQEAITSVSLALAPQTIAVHSHSFGLRALVNVGLVVWDTTASVGYNGNSTIYPDPFAPLTAQWRGREWAVDTVLGLRVPVGFLVVEPLAGARVNALHDDGYLTTGVFPITVPAQDRSTTTYRGEAKFSAPLVLDQYGTLTPWISGEVSRTNNPHPPLGNLTDLTGMAGGHYVFNLPNLESNGPFPGQTWRTAKLGMRLDVSPSFTLDAMGVWSFNDLGSWNGYRFGGTVKF